MKDHAKCTDSQNSPQALMHQTKEWLADLEDIGEERGYFDAAWARSIMRILSDASPTLLVTFETINSILQDRLTMNSRLALNW